MNAHHKGIQAARILVLAALLAMLVISGPVFAETMPGEPPPPERTLQDTDASLRADENRALSGDNILDNLYERPFTAEEMTYLPDVDIYSVDFSMDDNFVYFTIALKGGDEASGKLTGTYGIEFDRTKTGRGDLLVLASDPQPEWSMDNVTVYTDSNGDVGGKNPTLAESNYSGDGYDTTVTLEGDKSVYTRIDPEDETAIQFAISRALLENPEEFMWGAWADKMTVEPAKFDLNDVFSPSEAGSPIKDSKYYPVKALYSLDNTCRVPYGFNPETGTVPGMCVTVPPTLPTNPQTPPRSPTGAQ